MAKAFAAATNQDAQVFYSCDTRGRGRSRVELKGIAAEAAWSIPVKEAEDLGGKVPYIPGMPVFCTDNIATELGISKGCQGTLVRVKYVERGGRKYAVSAAVDFAGYHSPDPMAEHPNRVVAVLIAPVSISAAAEVFRVPM
ncbi:hypothetical protein FB45DRAFT_981599 [Roridomyces roridus]|uniref:Uncharacterized protein n=1 Tax=Roridomyces roridus TaxID=1738132 RepID=A0AAD7BBD1_9AGAR|nr:hypothetical protein FB45DRAFT_981599 [Roridomyces roridus]